MKVLNMPKENLLLHYGLLPSINGTNVQFEGSQFVSVFDEVLVQPPGSGAIGSKTKDSDTYNFFEVIAEANKAVWVYVPMSNAGGFANAAAANTAIKAEIDTFTTWFADYSISSLLKGFFLDEFGFDFQYTDSAYVSRADQNAIITYAHSTKNKPVFLNAWYISDVFTNIGPNHGGEDGNALSAALAGSDSSYTDYVLIENPISNLVKDDGSTSWNYTRPAYVAKTIQTYSSGKSLKFASVQQFDLTSSPVDSRIGLTVNANIKARMQGYTSFMLALGVDIIGSADNGYGASSNKALHAYISDMTDAVEDYNDIFGHVYSDAGTIYVKNTRGTHSYNSEYKYQSSI